jgi:hypothetical protein
MITSKILSGISIVSIFLMVVVGGYAVSSGAIAGLSMALGIAFLVSKLPTSVKSLLLKQAFITDLILTSGSTILVAGLFGPGLILGIASITCGLVLSVILVFMKPDAAPNRVTS